MNGKPSQEQRNTINYRERCRMHSLNDALKELLKCLPYSQSDGANVRKFSKLAILLLAINHIITQEKAVNEMRQQIITKENAINEQKQHIAHCEKHIQKLEAILQKKESK